MSSKIAYSFYFYGCFNALKALLSAVRLLIRVLISVIPSPGLYPDWFFKFGSAWLITSNKTISLFIFSAAKCKGPDPYALYTSKEASF